MSPNGKKSTQVENHQHRLRVPNCSNFTPNYLLNHQKKLLYTRPLWNRFSRKPAKETPLMNPVQCLSKPVSTDTHTQSKLLTTWPLTQSLLTSGLKEERSVGDGQNQNATQECMFTVLSPNGILEGN